MSIGSRLNDWLIKKAAKSKTKNLFAVKKKVLFTRIHELSEYVDYLESRNEILEDRINQLSNKKTLLSETEKLEKELAAMKGQNKINKTELAYQGLLKRYEEVQKQNKELKATIDTVDKVLDTIKSQNEFLKERLKRIEGSNETLQAVNKNLNEKLDKTLEKRLEPVKKKVINHSFIKGNSNTDRKAMIVTRQVNN